MFSMCITCIAKLVPFPTKIKRCDLKLKMKSECEFRKQHYVTDHFFDEKA